MKPINSKVSAHLRFVTVCLDRMYPSIQRMGMCTGLEEWDRSEKYLVLLPLHGPIIAAVVPS
jgi:hypothetical protein